MYGSESRPIIPPDDRHILVHKDDSTIPIPPVPKGWVVINIKTINALAVIISGFACVLSQVALAILQKHVYVEVLGTGASLLIGTTILRLEDKHNGRS
jgi:hypothetical protein